MSIDTYFCFCCLSTNNLFSLYINDTNTNYANLLQNLFKISISFEDYEYDGHICTNCAESLISIQKFKTQVFETLKILQNNELIATSHENEIVKVKKTQESFLEIEEKHVIEEAAKYIALFDEKSHSTSKDQERTEEELLGRLTTKSNTTTIERDHIVEDRSRNTVKQVPQSEVTDRQRAEKKKEKRIVKNVSQYEVPDDLKCVECGLVLPNNYTYHAHMNEHYPNHICDSCGKGFLTEKRLKRHMRSHKTGPFKCKVCDAEFSNYNTLESHRQRKHSTVELYKCPHCDERFSTFTRRAVHLAAQHQFSTGKYECNLCGRRFLISGGLSAHVRRAHVKPRAHACGTCGALFPYPRDLIAHSHKHTNQHPYHCSICNNKYPRKKALVVHMRTHTGERRFACEVCGKRFLQKCSLLVHAKTHNRSSEPKTVETVTVEYSFVKWNETNCT